MQPEMFKEDEHAVSTSSPKNTKFSSLKTKSVQTDYREDEAQTEPWDPPYSVSSKSGKVPEVLSLKHLTFGNGLPIRDVEFNYILEAKNNNKLLQSIESNNASEQIKGKLEYSDIKAQYNYRVGIENEKQLDKLYSMNKAAIRDFLESSHKKDVKLRYLWSQRKNKMNKRNFDLEENLRKECAKVDFQFLKLKESASSKSRALYLEKLKKQRNALIEEGTSFMLTEYYLRESNLKSWFDDRPQGLTIEIPLAKPPKLTAREKLAEKAFEDVLQRKKPKLPKKVYHEEYVKEPDPKQPRINPEVVNEFFDFHPPEKDPDSEVLQLQKALRGLACQKQMAQMIERHKDGLIAIVTPLL